MRAFDVTAAALALGVPRKWLDNLLCQNHLPGVRRGRQGIKRRLQPCVILQIEIALCLAADLDLSMSAALTLAGRVIGGGGMYRGTAGTEIRFATSSLERSLAERLAAAAESAPPRKRGRPPKSAASLPAQRLLNFLDASSPDSSELRKA